MRNLKRLIAIVLILLVLTVSLPTVSVFAADSDMRYGRKKLGEMTNGTNLQYVYDQLVSGCESAKESIDIDLNNHGVFCDQETIDTIYKMFYSDYPEYFWINGAWSASSNGITLTIKPAYTMTGSTLASAKSAYNTKVNEITSGLSGSHYDKAKTLHDRLINAVNYVSTDNDQNAYGALVDGKAVCNGYAKAYQHLMLKAGIPAWYVRGTSINPSTGTPIGHAWNLVKLDGEWYYTDVTWNDQGQNTFYTYFNITTKQLLEGHTFDNQYKALVPQATATSANYYIKEGRSLSGYDQDKLISLLKKDNNKTQIYVNGDVDSFINSLNINLLGIASKLGATGSYSASYNLAKLGNAIILNIIIISGNHTHSVKTTVSKVNETCLANGTKAYYNCDCGLKFLDQACTQQVINEVDLNIPAKSHTPSNWKNDVANHWKECTQCGSESANTRSAHTDGNKDNKCDTCGYALPITDKDGNITAIGTSGNSNSTNQNTANNDTSQTNNSSVVSDILDKTESVSNDDTSIENESEDIITVENASSYEELYLYPDHNVAYSALKWVLICCGSSVLVATGIAVILINRTKRK